MRLINIWRYRPINTKTKRQSIDIKWFAFFISDIWQQKKCDNHQRSDLLDVLQHKFMEKKAERWRRIVRLQLSRRRGRLNRGLVLSLGGGVGEGEVGKGFQVFLTGLKQWHLKLTNVSFGTSEPCGECKWNWEESVTPPPVLTAVSRCQLTSACAALALPLLPKLLSHWHCEPELI